MLDPTHRALLELSLHREVADPALAELLRTDVDAVGRQRAEALRRMADELEAAPEEVEPALIRHWRHEETEETPEAEEAPEAYETPEVHDAHEPEEAAGAAETEPARRPRRALWAGLTGMAVLGLVLVLILAGGGDDEENGGADAGGAPSEPAEESPPPPREGPQQVELEPLFGGQAAGTASIVRRPGADRVLLRVSGLSEENHAVWLYDSIGEARPVASFAGPQATARFRLPEGYDRFGYLDVSREPPDGNPNHSGESVLRVPTRDLAVG